MGWDDQPPSEAELKKKPTPIPVTSWDSEPPTESELSPIEQGDDDSGSWVKNTPIGQTFDAVMDYGVSPLLKHVVAPLGKMVDRYTGAPTRAAVQAGVQGSNPIDAFTGQFGEDPELAPTGKDLVKPLGLSQKPLSDVLPSMYSDTGKGLQLQRGGLLDPTAEGAAGLAADVATDWTNLIPGALAVKSVAKGGLKTAGATAKAATRMGVGATDIVTGTRAASKLAEGAEKIAETGKNVIDSVLTPRRSPEFSQSVEIAKKHGIDPNALSSDIEFGKNSGIARMERVRREGITGEKALEAHKEGFHQIDDALHRTIQRHSGGLKLSQPEAGALIRQSFDDASKKLFDSMDISFNKVQKYAPGLYVNKDAIPAIESKLSGIEKFAKGQLRRGITDTSRGQATQLLRAVAAVRNSKYSFKQTVEAMQSIGKEAFGKTKNSLADVPVDKQKFGELYHTMNEALVETIRKDVNPDFAKELEANNAMMSSYFGDKSILAPIIGDIKTADEDVFKRLIINGDTKQIASFKTVVPPEAFNQLKSTFIESISKPTPDGVTNFEHLARVMREKRNQMGSIFTPEELQELAEIVKLGKDHGPYVMSTSGTGASNALRDLPARALEAVQGEKIIDALKSRARGNSPLLDYKTPTEPLDMVPALSDAKQSPLLPRRGPVEKRLKAAQSIAPSYYERDNKKAK